GQFAEIVSHRLVWHRRRPWAIEIGHGAGQVRLDRAGVGKRPSLVAGAPLAPAAATAAPPPPALASLARLGRGLAAFDALRLGHVGFLPGLGLRIFMIFAVCDRILGSRFVHDVLGLAVLAATAAAAAAAMSAIGLALGADANLG